VKKYLITLGLLIITNAVLFYHSNNLKLEQESIRHLLLEEKHDYELALNKLEPLIKKRAEARKDWSLKYPPLVGSTMSIENMDSLCLLSKKHFKNFHFDIQENDFPNDILPYIFKTKVFNHILKELKFTQPPFYERFTRVILKNIQRKKSLLELEFWTINLATGTNSANIELLEDDKLREFQNPFHLSNNTNNVKLIVHNPVTKEKKVYAWHNK